MEKDQKKEACPDMKFWTEDNMKLLNSDQKKKLCEIKEKIRVIRNPFDKKEKLQGMIICPDASLFSFAASAQTGAPFQPRAIPGVFADAPACSAPAAASAPAEISYRFRC